MIPNPDNCPASVGTEPLKCSECQQLKPPTEFYKSARNLCRQQRDNACKNCHKRRAASYYAANAETVKKNHQIYYAAQSVQVKSRRYEWKCNNIAKYLFRCAKKRAKRKGFLFNIDVLDIVVPKTCPILGITLSLSRGKPAENSPSVDRIDSAKGYVKGNVRVISYRANKLKNNATLEELQMIVADAEQIKFLGVHS
jgi:hypothetical protein